MLQRKGIRDLSVESETRRREHRRRALACESLETRCLLSTTALVTRDGTIDAQHPMATIELPLDTNRLTPGASGKTMLDVTVQPTEGSKLNPAAFRVIGPNGRPLKAAVSRHGKSITERISVAPGDYSVKIQGKGRTAGTFQMTVDLLGDVAGGRTINAADLTAIQAAIGTRPAGNFGGFGDHQLVTRQDLRIARQNLGATNTSILLNVQNQTEVFPDSQVFASIYGLDPSMATTDDPAGWVYLDASGVPHALTLANATVPSFPLSDAPNGVSVANNQVLISGQIYLGLGSPVTLNVNRGVSSVSVVNGGSGYTSTTTVAFSGGGGSGAQATAQVSGGVVTAFTGVVPGNGYSSNPTVTVNGAGNGATATAQVTVSGVAAPAPSNANDPNNSIYWDFAEFTLNNPYPNINADLSQVDQVGISHTLQLTPADASNPNGSGVYVTRPALFDDFKTFINNAAASNSNISDFLPLATNSGSGQYGPYRILAPSNYVLLNPTDNLASYFNTYINQVFTAGNTVTIQVPNAAPQAPVIATPVVTNGVITSVKITNAGAGYAFAPAVSFVDSVGTGAKAVATINPTTGVVTGITVTNGGSNYTSNASVVFGAPTPATFTGTVVSSGGSTMYQFTTTDPSQAGVNFNVYSPFTPYAGDPASSQATWEVFGNSGVFADNTLQFGSSYGEAQILGNIENQVVSAMNRGVATLPYSSWTNAQDFYPAGSTANWYAAFLHQSTITIGGNAYGFAFDDQGGNSTDISVSNPQELTVTLSSWKKSS